MGWELIDFARYSYWSDKRAVVVQFSRGCPHQCSYCGQRFFWRRWRHRDPRKFAAEMARLHREHGVEVINFADQNGIGWVAWAWYPFADNGFFSIWEPPADSYSITEYGTLIEGAL